MHCLEFAFLKTMGTRPWAGPWVAYRWSTPVLLKVCPQISITWSLLEMSL